MLKVFFLEIKSSAIYKAPKCIKPRNITMEKERENRERRRVCEILNCIEVFKSENIFKNSKN